MIRILCVLLLAVFTCHGYYIVKNNGTTKKSKIVGGETVDISEVPYMAQLCNYYDQKCGAVIISDVWLITAAHCIESHWIRTGSSDRNKGQLREVAYAMYHADYNNFTFDNDIGLIRLVNPITFNMNQKPIKISAQPPTPYQEVKIAGFGQVGDKLPLSPVLKAANAPVIDTEECKKRYINKIPLTDNMFCAGNGQTDTCTGDSGGPAVINNELVGISSSGGECSSKQYPGVYTLVYNYRDWIAHSTKIKL